MGICDDYYFLKKFYLPLVSLLALWYQFFEISKLIFIDIIKFFQIVFDKKIGREKSILKSWFPLIDFWLILINFPILKHVFKFQCSVFQRLMFLKIFRFFHRQFKIISRKSVRKSIFAPNLNLKNRSIQENWHHYPDLLFREAGLIQDQYQRKQMVEYSIEGYVLIF